MLSKEDVVSALVENGADIDNGEPPPITIAASLGRLESVKLLIDKGVDLTAEDSDGRTALDLAENFKKTEIAQLLRRAGCQKGDNSIYVHDDY